MDGAPVLLWLGKEGQGQQQISFGTTIKKAKAKAKAAVIAGLFRAYC
jgi:hypothetical protein